MASTFPDQPLARAPARPTPVRRRRRAPAWIAAPAVLVVVVALLPLVYLVVRAGGAGPDAVALLGSARTWAVLGRSLLLAGLTTAASIALGVPLAWLVTRTDLPGRRIWAVLVALPLVVPSFIGAFTYIAALGPRGMLQSLLSGLGVDRLPEIYGLPGAVLTITMFAYPYVLLTVRGALLGMDPALEDASRSLGRPAAATFRAVTLPLLRPAIGAGGLLVALYTLADFGAVSLMRYDSFTRVIFTSYRAAFDRTPAAVLAVVLVAVTVVVLAVETRLGDRSAGYRVSARGRRPPPTVALGRWRVPALLLCTAVVTLALVVPLSVLLFWLVRGVGAGEPLRLAADTWVAAWRSLQASALAAGCAVAAAVPVVVWRVRHDSLGARLAERATYLSHALPGIVVALSLVFLGARYGGPLYQSLAVLVLAYVTLFLPQAVGAAHASLLQVPPNLEEAGRGLGLRGPQVLRRITLPLVLPGLLSGGALVFLTAMKELPATLLLGPTGYRTLATAVWGATVESFYARAAAPALVLIALSSLPLALLLHRRERRWRP
ncbi:MAG TPA: iron ABC transporter permease [Euzebyales bacterium]|nr:iron ABC transporter permease [Euzebyales bacterium]